MERDLSSFKGKDVESLTLEDRKYLYKCLSSKYPSRVPIIVKLPEKGEQVGKKFLVPREIEVTDRAGCSYKRGFTLMDLIYKIRQEYTLTAEEAIFLTCGNKFPSVTDLIVNVYREHKSECGFLFVNVLKENTFG
jgi:hypothetical protein